MKRSVFLVIAALFAAVFGVALLFTAPSFMAMHGMTLTYSGMFTAKILGASMLGLAVTYWMSRSAADSPAMSGILLGGLLVNIIQIVVALRAIMSGLANSMAWGPVVIHGFLILGFAYFSFAKKGA
jgi:hypothetical protein